MGVSPAGTACRCPVYRLQGGESGAGWEPSCVGSRSRSRKIAQWGQLATLEKLFFSERSWRSSWEASPARSGDGQGQAAGGDRGLEHTEPISTRAGPAGRVSD